MDQITRHPNADLWLDRMFAAKAAEGQVIRRNIDWVEREVGRDRFIEEIRARRFHLLQTADQFVVICHPGAIHLLF
jgi:hypothetical protein